MRPSQQLRGKFSSVSKPHRRALLAQRGRTSTKCASVPPIPEGVTMPNKSRSYFFFPPPIFPVVPIFGRETYRYEVIPDRMWRFEQKQGIGLGLNVAVNVCMTVIKMNSGGLFVYSPIAPTKECVALIEDLGAPVEYIVLPTTLFEHKVFVGPFQRKFPKAEVYVCPGQWSWPLDLPPSFFGIFLKGFLDDTNRGASLPFADEFEVEILQPGPIGVSNALKFNEAAMLHKPTGTLLVVDAVVYASDRVPDVISEEALLESGNDDNIVVTVLKLINLFGIRDKAKARTRGSKDMSKEEVLDLGWQRNALQALYFGPVDLLEPAASWEYISDRLIVAPIVSTLVYSNAVEAVEEWVDRICRWKFQRIMPCHFDGPIQSNPREFRSAFRVLRETDGTSSKATNPLAAFFSKDTKQAYYPPDDVLLLQIVGKFLKDGGVIFTDENRPTTFTSQIEQAGTTKRGQKGKAASR
eukprot:CAMPEP_0118923952 /NCGR_PEP_ID=MMETSP1169-20130426/2286_1 /TAXON_ID=36882 /ORGANISM="Pyramimonas obovata, Strain CCMP722" /LENGTH=466 /DNA_ID=CAMNT_0006865017 /DNA_START=146 /DNA_END=1546 /DNA_ORIENTATION=+